MLKKTEFYLTISSITAFVLNLFLIPFSSELLIISLGSLSMLYLYFSFALLNNVGLRAVFQQKALKGVSVFKTLGAILVGGALSISIIGILFKLMQWSMANMLILTALPFIIVAGIVYFILFKKNKEDYYKGILIRLWGVGNIIFILFMLPKYFLIDFKYRNNPEYLEAYKNWQNDKTEDPEIFKKYQEELEKLN